MDIDLMNELEACVHSVPEFASLPIVWGINANLVGANVLPVPRIAIYAYVPTVTEEHAWGSLMRHDLVISHHSTLAESMPTDKDSIAAAHGIAKALRQTIRAIADRQISGASTYQIDLDSTPRQEINFLDKSQIVSSAFSINLPE